MLSEEHVVCVCRVAALFAPVSSALSDTLIIVLPVACVQRLVLPAAAAEVVTRENGVGRDSQLGR